MFRDIINRIAYGIRYAYNAKKQGKIDKQIAKEVRRIAKLYNIYKREFTDVAEFVTLDDIIKMPENPNAKTVDRLKNIKKRHVFWAFDDEKKSKDKEARKEGFKNYEEKSNLEAAEAEAERIKRRQERNEEFAKEQGFNSYQEYLDELEHQRWLKEEWPEEQREIERREQERRERDEQFAKEKGFDSYEEYIKDLERQAQRELEEENQVEPEPEPEPLPEPPIPGDYTDNTGDTTDWFSEIEYTLQKLYLILERSDKTSGARIAKDFASEIIDIITFERERDPVAIGKQIERHAEEINRYIDTLIHDSNGRKVYEVGSMLKAILTETNIVEDEYDEMEDEGEEE